MRIRILKMAVEVGLVEGIMRRDPRGLAIFDDIFLFLRLRDRAQVLEVIPTSPRRNGSFHAVGCDAITGLFDRERCDAW